MRRFMTYAAGTAILAVWAAAAAGQTQTPPPSTAATPPGTLSETVSTTPERRDAGLPAVNIYLPEGQASVRLRKLIRNVLFESQIDYEFVNGDISTYLRYKYYARNYTYRLGVFDSIEFPGIEDKSNRTEFERVRGGLLTVGIPKNYNNRYFATLQNDRLTFGDILTDNVPGDDDEQTRRHVDNRQNNIYLKLAYQYGSQFDERMNSIVGETRGRVTPVLTAFRDIGPQRTGLAVALTQSAKVATGDYQYTKLEAEGLRRFDLTATSFIFSRLHVGSFLSRKLAERDVNGDGVIDNFHNMPEEFPEVERYTIPRYEMFRLGGREALKAIDGRDEGIGTQEIHLTNELFVPIFRNRNYKTGPLFWNTLYGIGYVGVGSVGYHVADLPDRLAYDAGIGAEAAITVRDDFDVYLSVVFAKTIKAPQDIEGQEVRFSVRTVR